MWLLRTTIVREEMQAGANWEGCHESSLIDLMGPAQIPQKKQWIIRKSVGSVLPINQSSDNIGPI